MTVLSIGMALNDECGYVDYFLFHFPISEGPSQSALTNQGSTLVEKHCEG